MIHIVFQHADVHVLKEAMKLDDSLSGDVVEMKDEWGVGPLKDLDTEEGWAARQQWWQQVLIEAGWDEKPPASFDDRQTVKQLKDKLDEDPTLQVWIWVGPNQHDVTGYFWLVPRLREYQSRVYVLQLHNLPFLNEKGQLFYPVNVQDILPKEAVKAKKLARPLSAAEFEMDADEWKKLCEENALVRQYDGGKKVTGREVDFYDKEILNTCTAEWQKATRVLTHTLHRMKIKTGDVFLKWRMKQLINEGKIEMMGDVNEPWKALDVKKPGVQSENVNEGADAVSKQ